MIMNFNHKYTVLKSSYLVTDIQCNVKVLNYRSGEFYLQYDWGCYSKEMTDIEIAHRYLNRNISSLACYMDLTKL